MGQTTLTFWQLLLIAIGPATLTAIVALASAALQEARKRKAEWRIRRAEKLEELISKVYEFDNWVGRSIKNNALGEKHEIGTTPLSKLEAIANIYFPQFKSEIDDLALKGLEYIAWSAKAGQKRLNNESNYIDGMTELYKPFRKALIDLLSSLAKLAKTEFK